MVELIILLVICILLALIIYFRPLSSIHTVDALEGFMNPTIPSESAVPIEESFEDISQFHLNACPVGYTLHYDQTGQMICCDGEFIAGRCMGKQPCVLNSSKTDGSLPSCVAVLSKEYAEKGASQCPPSMPAYFEDRGKKVKGCTNGMLNETMTGPRTDSQPVCVMYGTLEENLNKKDSCHNYKKMDEFSCFGVECRKEIVQTKDGAPAMIAVHFTDPDGMFHIAYTRDSMENYLNVTQPGWRDRGTDLQKNIQVAEVAKAYYVDKTIKDVQV